MLHIVHVFQITKFWFNTKMFFILLQDYKQIQNPMKDTMQGL
jgi:hypothetical protein